ncbi:extracellular solute-binding protein [Paenibacillus thalictri]|nr:extracellular solute-binding protein [Paenibacillus thalictri]
MNHYGWKIAATLAAGLAIAGCSDSKEKQAAPAPGQAAAPAAPAGPLEISFMGAWAGEPPQANSESQKIIENATNTKLTFQWLASAAADEKINVTIASGQMPKTIGTFLKPTIINAIRNNTFWEIGPYLKDYPNLSKISPLIYQNVAVDGKTYALPRVRPLVRDAVIYRKDWLKNVGMQEPKTIDELYAVMKAFTLNDPDKNGKNDTLGSFEYKSMNLFDFILPAFGAPNKWSVQNGKFTPDFMTKEYMDAMKFYKKLYDEKLINQDFAVAEKTQFTAAFDSSKAGTQADVSLNAVARQTALRKTVPQVETDFIGVIEGTRGPIVYAGPGNNGVVLISKSSVKTEAELKQILGFFNKLADDPVATLLAWGIEGKHYKKANGVNERIDAKLYETEVKPYREMKVHGDEKEFEGNLDPLTVKANKSNADREKLAIADPSLPLFSQTFTDKGAQLNKIIEDARVKFIMGKVDEAGFKAEIDQWVKSGGDKVIKEYEEDFARAQKK